MPCVFSLIADYLARREPTWLPSSLREPHLPYRHSGRTSGLEYHLVLAVCNDGDDLIRTYLRTDTTARAHRYSH